MLSKNEIDKIMKHRGFYYDKTIKAENPQNTSYVYIKENDVTRYDEYVILVEVFVGGTWHLFYHQPKMVGFMDSGEHGKLEDEFNFKRVYNAFNKQVELLRNGIR